MKKVSFVLISLCLFCSCMKTDEKKASDLLLKAEKHIQNKEWNTAKVVLDSIHQEYASLVKYRRMADTLGWEIRLFEHERTLAYIDTLLPTKIEELNALKKAFIFTKDTLYQDFGTYLHRKMQTIYNYNRAYLKPIVDERGQLSIMSQFYGEVSVQHHALTLESENVLYRSKDAGVYNSFLEEKMYVENLLFENAEAINIANFVTNRNQNTIKVSLKGIRDYVYYLTKTDKEAIVATFNFSVVLADCYKLEQERTFVLHEIEKLKKRIR